MIRSENLLEGLFENSKSIVLVTDDQYNIRYCSSTVENIFGIKPFSVLGKNAFDFVPEDKRTAWAECLKKANGNKSSEIKLHPSGSELYFDVSVTNHVSNQEIKGLVIMLHDITDRKLEQQQLQKENDQLDQFIFKTTHDLRAPINSALGLVSLAENASEEEKLKYLQMVRASLMKLETFIEEVNSFYKNDKMAIQTERIEIESMLQTEIEALQNLPSPKKISFEVTHERSVDLYSDYIRVKTILTNIVSNSIKYSDPAKEEPFIRVHTKVTQQNLTVTIADNGIGIDSRYLDKIYDIFFRATQHGVGTGLGLYIVKDTVEKLNGRITVASEPGKGTTFTITIPNHYVSGATIKANETDISITSRGAKAIL
jgi:PAS domain S-box-containing protein